MNNTAQSKLWPFITEYKRVTGSDLSYLHLIQSEMKLKEYIDDSFNYQDRKLRVIASELQNAIGQQSTTTARAGKRVSPKITVNKFSNADRKIPILSAKLSSNHIAINQYRNFFKKVILESDITILQREELDNFCRRRSLTIDEVLEIEKDVRVSFNKPKIDWEDEVRRSIRRFISLHGKLTETDKLMLLNAYVQKERLSLLLLENMIEEELSHINVSGADNSISLIKKTVWAMAGVAAVLAVAVIGLYMRTMSPDDKLIADEVVAPKELRVSGSITQSTIWKAATTYILSGPVFVEGQARLTIEPGTRIVGEFGSALIVTRDAELHARGQYNAPVVFTSSKPEGERQRGDWGGVVLLGNATINQPSGHIEGIDKEDIRGQFGGNDDTDSCGVLEYARIEYAGFEVFADNELNGLTMGGCGNTTIVRHVQVHQAADDGIEMFGGTADLKNIVITGAKDDSLDWDMGWRGRVQFMVIQQYDDAGDNGFEADNWGKNHEAEPRSNPTMYNVTMIGSSNPDSAQRAINLRRGTAGEFHNFIVMGHSKEFLDIRDDVTANLASAGQIQFSNSILFDIGKNGKAWFALEDGKGNDDSGFSEKAFIASQYRIELGVDPLLPSAQKQSSPNFSPDINSPANVIFSSIPQEEFWSEGALYAGAIRPGAQAGSWLSGWTDYSQN